ncbi:Ig-like domain-containing protein [Kitasatospora sp. McL0602]|uniref:L,D-transpeptidase n=1 Tax=Kitasatospora sp. McL0602 TaxID=3439530 RepID=UPI003F8CB1FE
MLGGTYVKSKRRGLAAGVLGGALLLSTAACGGSGAASAGSTPSGAPGAASTPAAAPKPTVSAAVVSIEPADGAKDVKPSGVLKVSVASGRLSSVKVTDKDGKEVAGAITTDGAGWAPKGALAVGAQYTVSAAAADASGLATTARSSFSTLTPEDEASPHDNVDSGSTYGTGMIVSLEFDRDVQDKKAVEQGVTFDAPGGVAVKGHWFGSRRVDFRPEKYWTPDSKVTVHYRLKGVEIAPGVYGGVDRDEPFSIGRSQVTTVDAGAHEMKVERGGQVETVAVTTGKSGFATWSGVMVIEEKAEHTRMTSQGVSGVAKGDEYDLASVPHAMRLTTSGTYVHGNSWALDAMGSYNASHGCIGVADSPSGSASSDAGKFFDSSLIGDVVKVVNSKGATVDADNGLSGWNVGWGDW